MSIPLLSMRLNAWEAKRSFKRKLTEIQQAIDIVFTGCNQLKNSTKFVKILEIVLAVGNYINGSTGRGGAWGFKLNSLLKMLDVRNSNRITLMHYVANLVEQQYPECKELSSDLTSIEGASRENIQMIEGDLNRLRNALAVVDTLSKHPDAPDDSFKASLLKFFEPATQYLDQVRAKIETLKSQYKKVVEYFSEDPKTQSEDFFGNVYAFIIQFEKAKNDNLKKKSTNKKQQLAHERQKKLFASIAKKHQSPTEKAEKENDGVLGDLYSELTTGEAYTEKAIERRKSTQIIDKKRVNRHKMRSKKQ